MRMDFASKKEHKVVTNILTKTSRIVMTCVLMIAMILANTVAIAEEPYIRDGGTIMYVCVEEDSYLNGRAEPSRNSEITMKLSNGDYVEVVGYHGEWLEIVGGEYGTCFVSAEFISEFKEPLVYVNVSGGRVFIRDGIDGDTTGHVVKTGKTVRVRLIIDNWGYIGNGWVNLKYFEPEVQ